MNMRLRNLLLFRWIDYTSTTGETESHHVPELRSHRVWTTGFEFIRGHKEKTRWQLEEEGWARSASYLLPRTVSDQRQWTARRKQVACVCICVHCAVAFVRCHKIGCHWKKAKQTFVHTFQTMCKTVHLQIRITWLLFSKLTHHLLK
jgi:hypothetical protein